MTTQFFTFEPPYESPVEEDLAWHLTKHLGDTVELMKQKEVETSFGTFRLDLVAKDKSGRMFTFECDGKDYHTDSFRDLCRDALIILMGKQVAIYRFRGQDLYYHMNDCLYVVCQKEPHLFSPRGLRNIELLASDEVKVAYLCEDMASAFGTEKDVSGYWNGNRLTVIYYRGEEENRREFTVEVERRSFNQSMMDSSVQGFLKFAFDQRHMTTFGELYNRYLQHLKK